ncbi:MAG: hypothetical protein JJT94_06510 [Bernardetiaceae bacterium]|nr:hypothetical protein [Bernardetiaceae bacterium]
MEDLLRNDFTAHYGIPVCTEPNLVIQTSETYFEIEDTTTKEITLHRTDGEGMARFSNPNSLVITIANYDKFVTSLPIHFQNGRKRCDIIVCDDERNLIFGEIKDSPNIKQHRKKAKKQLYESLTTLLAVPQFLALSNNKIVKRCCYFNKQTNSPAILTATTAFNRLSTIFQDGFQMSHPGIEGHNFEFWEYLGGHTFTLT